MNQHTAAKTHLRILLVLIAGILVLAGCGGQGSNTASNGAPGPSPTPVPGTASLTATPSSLAFGSIVLNSTSSQSIKLTNTGQAGVTISQDTVSGAAFSTGITTPLTLNAGQSVNVPVVFKPSVAGSQSGTLVFSGSSASLVTIPLSGTGVTPLQHSVDVSWLASSTTTVQAYNVYRSTVSGGPYTRVSPAVSPTGLLFTDSTVVSGQTYFYVVTAVDSNSMESIASNEVSVAVPIP